MDMIKITRGWSCKTQTQKTPNIINMSDLLVIQQGEYCFQVKLVELIKILNNLGARNISELDLEMHIISCWWFQPL